MKHTRALKTGLVALALTATLGLAGCSDTNMGNMAPSSSAAPSSPSASTSASAEFNNADVMFVEMMLPHHEQAVAMSDTLLAKTGVNPDVTALAQQIKAAQQPEIDTMKGYLTTWGQQQMGGGGMGGMNHGASDGMATDAELKEFGQSDGKTGQKAYLQLMTAHHQGAIKMAQAEVSNGKSPDAVALAKNIITTQQQEVGVMKELLAKL